MLLRFGPWGPVALIWPLLVLVIAQNDAVEETECHGTETEEDSCESLPPCSGGKVVDCEVGDWSEWAPLGTCSGLQERARNITTVNNEFGKPCNFTLAETVEYDEPDCVPEVVNCELGDWGEWTSCLNTTTGQTHRSRSIVTNASMGGEPCEDIVEETKPCHDNPQRQDCILGDWTQWTDCSVTCGIGRQTQRRVPQQYALLGGLPCEATMMKVQICDQGPCPPQNCEVSEWSSWAGCNETSPAAKLRRREVVQPSIHGGIPCDAVLQETASCDSKPKESCQFSEWEDWSTCTKTCDRGQMYRQRWVTNLNRVTDCPLTELSETTECGVEPCFISGENDCQVSQWGDWSACSSECGPGHQVRTRSVAKDRVDNGRPCVESLQEVTSCESDACTDEKCAWGDWQEWTSCSASCGGGMRSRFRTASPIRGKSCGAESASEVMPCGTGSCDANANCTQTFEDWSEWSTCSAACVPSYRSRSRNISAQGASCAIPTTGPMREVGLCNESLGLPLCDPAAATQDCTYTDWSEWSNCSSQCYGTQERTRGIASPASGLGKACRSSLKEIAACNPGLGSDGSFEQPPESCETAREQCNLSDWDDWTPCSRTCDGGLTTRTRNITNPDCKLSNESTPLEEISACGEQPCSTESCQDCELEDWGEWSSCEKYALQKLRHRHVKQYGTCGSPCSDAVLLETEPCSEDSAVDEVYCSWTPWSDFSPCSVTCGSATRSRKRSLIKKTADEIADEDDYIFQAAGHLRCEGLQEEIGDCNLTSCTDHCEPQECEFSDWSDWQSPTCASGGLCTRNRSIANEGNECAPPCNGTLQETQGCDVPSECGLLRDCEFAEWTEWTKCASASDSRSRQREIAKEAGALGQACNGSTEEIRSCTGDTGNAEDCYFEDWSAWSECSVSCGSGTLYRHRHIAADAINGGNPCTGPLGQLKGCSSVPCDGSAKPLTCSLGPWGNWSACDEDYQKSRERLLLCSECAEGADCQNGAVDGPLVEVAPCDPEPIECLMSDWTDWTDCTRTCGGGYQEKHRLVKVLPQFGAPDCPPHLAYTRPCGEEPCSVIECTLSDWTSWSECTTSCGPGTETRSREVTPFDDTDSVLICDAALEQVRVCRHQPPCEDDVDCVWGNWSEWSECSVSCGEGMQNRSREIEVYPQGAGALCEVLNSTVEIQPCSIPCSGESECVDGLWSDWNDWSECSATCLGGTRYRHRDVAVQPSDCGTKLPSGLSTEIEGCNEETPCEAEIQNCTFSDWSGWSGCLNMTDCTYAIRNRSIEVEASKYGALCNGTLIESEPCDESLCEEHHAECQESGSWSDWSDCSEKCGTGQRTRIRECDHYKEIGVCPDLPPCDIVDCVWGAWSEWGKCTDPCLGESHRTRAIQAHARNGGELCNATDSKEVQTCEQCGPGPRSCTWSDWQEWSACSASCGDGSRNRSRTLKATTAGTTLERRYISEDAGSPYIVNDGADMVTMTLAFSSGIACSFIILMMLRSCTVQQRHVDSPDSLQEVGIE